MTSAGGLFMGVSKKGFLKGYSTPVNREVMRIFKDLDMLEQLGSVVHRIFCYYKKENFNFTDIFLRVTFKSILDSFSLTTQETNPD